ncbi:hypothetical protein KP509_32G023300 [Ceratopteris richardii]|uniref:F-box/LRR-repeat protein 15-like leucin rich repeat domain-containing protein n=1 Tax=Ceratopteris richardii TaxID=49495 RepID=A0A8T2QTW9_CERRI|nr:hypothetical protein KP509_32G023300 [Ceratopteris richardii]
MGGACSRKRSHDEGNGSPEFSKSVSFKWPHRSSFNNRSIVSREPCIKAPSLLEQAVMKACETVGTYESFAALPKDLSQHLLNELVKRRLLKLSIFKAFQYCNLEDVLLDEYPGVEDSWLEVIGAQGLSLLSADISNSAVSDAGLALISHCTNLQSLTLNYCDNISDAGLQHLTGLKNLSSLSFKRSDAVTVAGMCHLAELVNLTSLDLERCSQISGGLCHIEGLTKLERLNLGWCNYVDDQDIKALTGFVGLRELYISRTKVSDSGILCLKDMINLQVLHMEGCHIYPFCMETIAGLKSLTNLNLKFCGLSDFCCNKLKGLINLRVLNLAYNDITDAGLAYIKGLTNLEDLNLDSCKVGDAGLEFLKGPFFFGECFCTELLESGTMRMSLAKPMLMLCLLVCVADLLNLKSLNISDSEVTELGLPYISGQNIFSSIKQYFVSLVCMFVFFQNILVLLILSGLDKLENLNLSFTNIADSGLVNISRLTSLTSLNLDVRQVTDTGLTALTSLTNLKHLDLFGARITDYGTTSLKCFKKLQSLELCGGGISDVGVKNLKDLTNMTSLNLSQNYLLTDHSLEYLTGMTALVSLNISNTKVTNAGLQHLKPLCNLTSLALQACKVTLPAVEKLQATFLPNLAVIRVQ